MFNKRTIREPCPYCKKPIAHANKSTHLKKCRGKDKTLKCNQPNCSYFTTNNTDFKKHCREQHNLIVNYYTKYCLCCNVLVVRKTVHLKQKGHKENAEFYEGDPIINRFTFKLVPVREHLRNSWQKKLQEEPLEETEELSPIPQQEEKIKYQIAAPNTLVPILPTITELLAEELNMTPPNSLQYF